MDKNQLNEANATLSISDLNSSDMQALSQILSLAGQAESGGDMGVPPVGGVAPMAGPDGDLSSDVGSIDNNLGDVDTAIGTMEDASDAYGDEDMGMDDMVGGDELDVMEDIARLSGLDPLAESEEEALEESEEQLDEGEHDEFVAAMNDADEMSGDDYSDEEELNEGEHDEFIAAMNDADEMSGEDYDDEDVNESAEMRESLDAIDAILEAEDEELSEGEEEQLDENEHGHYNFDLDEDAAGELASPGIGDNREFGPYANEMACMNDARKEIPGCIRGKEVNLHHRPDGWYWTKTGKAAPKAVTPVSEDAEQSVEDLAAQLNEQFERFMKGD